MIATSPTLASHVKHHTWWLAGNLGVPGMPDWTTYRCNCGWEGDDPHAHVAEAWRDACTITTFEHLDSFPFLTLVREIFRLAPSGNDYGGVYERRASGWHSLAGAYVTPGDNGAPKLPVLLLWSPDWSKR